MTRNLASKIPRFLSAIDGIGPLGFSARLAIISRMIDRLTRGFALWLALGSVYAWLVPAHFTWALPYITPGLGVIMLGMGLTLTFADFRDVLRMPGGVGIGVVAQFVVMPLTGYTIARLFDLDAPLAVGLILMACCPGGTASNVITHLAGGNVPLSVLMTMSSTFLAIGLTPVLTEFYAGAYVPVPVGAMLLDMLQVVLAPLVLGLLANHFFPRITARLAVVSPLVSVIVIVLLVGAVLGSNKAAIEQAALPLLLAVFLVHSLGFALGYVAAALLGRNQTDTRTISIEVGMQNSGLGAKLAATHFTDPLTPVPSAISAVFHSLIGSALAAWWRRRPG